MSIKDSSAETGSVGACGEKTGAAAECESAKKEGAETRIGRGRYSEMQSAVRFPIHLPISVKSKSGESRSETQNISANGVLFQVVDSDMPVGSMIDFTISLPAAIVGAEADVRLDCKGRVVRNFEEAGRHGVGVVIDEYRFDRR